MVDLKQRSYQKELLDADDIPFADIVVCMKELNIVNTYLGGHAITREGIRTVAGKKASDLSICEIGCGGGDNLNAVNKAFKNVSKHFIGVDLKKECVAFAAGQYPALKGEWIASDYAEVSFAKQPDIIFTSLFCHHFTDEQLVFMLKWLHKNSRQGFFVNDLHRHWLAFYLIKWITAGFSQSYLVRHDASLSVARSFKKADWRRLMKEAGILNYSIKWRWAWRWLVLVKK